MIRLLSASAVGRNQACLVRREMVEALAYAGVPDVWVVGKPLDFEVA